MAFNEKLQSGDQYYISKKEESKNQSNNHVENEQSSNYNQHDKLKNHSKELMKPTRLEKLDNKHQLKYKQHSAPDLLKPNNAWSTSSTGNSKNQKKFIKDNSCSVIVFRNMEDDNIRKTKIKFNDKPKYQDLWALLLFVIVVITTIVLFIINLKYLLPSSNENVNYTQVNSKNIFNSSLISNFFKEHNSVKTKFSNSNSKQNISYSYQNYVQDSNNNNNNNNIDTRNNNNENIFDSLTLIEFISLMSFIIIITTLLSILYIILLQK